MPAPSVWVCPLKAQWSKTKSSRSVGEWYQTPLPNGGETPQQHHVKEKEDDPATTAWRGGNRWRKRWHEYRGILELIAEKGVQMTAELNMPVSYAEAGAALDEEWGVPRGEKTVPQMVLHAVQQRTERAQQEEEARRAAAAAHAARQAAAKAAGAAATAEEAGAEAAAEGAGAAAVAEEAGAAAAADAAGAAAAAEAARPADRLLHVSGHSSIYLGPPLN